MLFGTLNAFAQAGNIKERLIGYRTIEGELPADNNGLLFENDSARFYYSGNLIEFENPYYTYLNTPFDTLMWFLILDFSNLEYQQTIHPDESYKIDNQGYGIDNYWNIAFDSAVVFYMMSDSSFGYIATYNQTFENEQRNSYKLAYGNLIWDNWRFEFNEEHLLEKSFAYEGGYYGEPEKVIAMEEYSYDSGRLMSEHIDESVKWEETYIRDYTYSYDENGRFHTRELSITSPDGVEKTREELIYSGDQISTLNYYNESGDSWQLTGKAEFTYDGGKLIQVDFNDLDETTIDNYYKYFYNSNGRYDSISKYYRNGPDVISLRSIEKFDYDAEQRLTFYTFDNNIYSPEVGKIYVDYDYNEAGQIEELNYFIGIDGEGFYGTNYTYQYTPSGKIYSKAYNSLRDTEIIYDGTDDLDTTRMNWNTTYYYYEKIVSDPAGSETESIYVHAYPNPASGEINLLVGNTNSGGIITIEIMNIAGQKMFTEKTTSENNFTKTIDCTKFAGGIYFVTVSDGINTSWQKVIIQ